MVNKGGLRRGRSVRGSAKSLVRLEPGALVFLVACCIATTGRRRVVLLALEVLGYGVVLDDQPTGVTHGL